MGSRAPLKTVLIVEDEPLVMEIASQEFEDAGFAVLRAMDDRAALEVLESDHSIDLLFTDIRIPGLLDGWEIADRARALRPAIPVIYATGFTAEGMRMVDDSIFFKKPYRVSEVIAAVRQLGLNQDGA